MPRKIEDLTGRRFERLFVIKFSHRDKTGQSVWECICDCGKKTIAVTTILKRGKKRSCGCLTLEAVTKHGESFTPTNNIYRNMLQRCYNLNATNYPRYGGRGVTVCDRWRESYSNFREDMGERPEGLSLERKDNDKGYSPDNCRWATAKEQARNTRRTRFITFRGETRALTEWAERLNLNDKKLRYQLSVRPVDEAFSALGVN